MSCSTCNKTAPSFPSLTDQIAGFGQAMFNEARAVMAGQEPVSPEEKDMRLMICSACPNFLEGRCLLCGCFMTVKAGFRSASCPDNPPKW